LLARLTSGERAGRIATIGTLLGRLGQCFSCWSNVSISRATIFELSDYFGVMITARDDGRGHQEGQGRLAAAL
jgi:hypothetical protein